MTNAQLYLSIGVPIVVNVLFSGMLIGVMWASLDRRLNRIEDKIELVVGKVFELDNRIIRIEEKLNLPPR